MKHLRTLVLGLCVFNGSHASNIDSLYGQLKHGADSQRVAILLSICQELEDRYDLNDSLETMANEALQISNSLGLTEAKAVSLQQLGIIFRHQELYYQSADYFHKSSEIWSAIGNLKMYALNLSRAGLSYYYVGDYVKATDAYYKSLALREQLKDSSGIAAIYTNLGLVCIGQRKFEMAEKWLKDALHIHLKQNNKHKISTAQNNLGELYRAKGDYPLALRYYRDFYNAQLNGNVLSLAVASNNVGLALWDLKQFDSAIFYVDKALQIYRDKRYEHGIYYALIDLANIHLSIGGSDLAILHAEEGLSFARKTKVKEGVKNALEILSKAYRQKNNFKKSNEYLWQLMAVKDSIYNELSLAKVQDIESTHELNKKEAELQILQKESEIDRLLIVEQEAEIRRNKIQVASSVSGIVVLMIILGLLYNRKKLNEKVLALESIQQLQFERERISSDLHDHVGAQLTSIISGLQMTETIGNVDQSPQFRQLVDSLKEDAQVTITHLRDTIWTLKEEEITPSEFAEHIQKFAESALRYKEKPVFQIQNAASDNIKLNPSTALNLTRVVEEAIHNAIKHAEAEDLEINITSANDKLLIEIKDNGSGFQKENDLGKENYGLTNMKRRIAEIDGEINFQETPGNGVKVLISYPLPMYRS